MYILLVYFTDGDRYFMQFSNKSDCIAELDTVINTDLSPCGRAKVQAATIIQSGVVIKRYVNT
jgi:hypothetical protein